MFKEILQAFTSLIHFVLLENNKMDGHASTFLSVSPITLASLSLIYQLFFVVFAKYQIMFTHNVGS